MYKKSPFFNEISHIPERTGNLLPHSSFQAFTIYLDLTNYVDNMESKFIKGDLDIDANWEDFQAQLQKYDVNGMCEIYQAALDRYNARPGQITVD